MIDNRIALERGTTIKLSGDKEIQINEEVGRGASCIVYDAAYLDNIGVRHIARVKECFPSYLLIFRDSSGCLTTSEFDSEKFELAKHNFIESYRKNADIRNTLGITNSTINYTDIVYQNNTIYIIMAYDEGIDYRKYRDKSLKELFTHAKSLAEVIRKYHQNNYLHLDIKPENVFIIPETDEHILLFDFDSVMSFDELAQNSKFRLSFSDGFSAPEQIQGKINKIGMHTDIFSIGAIVFYKLFNRKPKSEDCKISSIYNFEKMQFSSEKYQPKLYRVLQTFLKKTLSISVVPRWHDMQQVINQLEDLIVLSDTDGVYLIDSFQYNSACFIGRAEELEAIDNILSDNQLVFLSGIGGIGKTELAKQYANKYRSKYDTIVFAVFEKDIESLVCDEIMINNICKDENESSADYFKRKIEILKHIATPNDLIIIDNFDVDSDDNLEILFTCPCKFIITTRMDFRDFNYEQINIDKIDNLDDILKLFYSYNDTSYSDTESDAVIKLINYVDNHTMTVELTAKYLRITKILPTYLFERFLEKEGTANTEEINVKQRKDRKLRSDSVNNHLRILFDISAFDKEENEIVRSLSLFAGIRIHKQMFIKICAVENVESRLNYLIKTGWIEYNDLSEKISLHQVIQDLIYNDLKPNAENCPHIVNGMIEYVSLATENYYETKTKLKVFDVFMNRMSGNNITYANLCLKYGKENKLAEAEMICLTYDNAESYDILQRIYRKRLKILCECNDMFETELDLNDYLISQLNLIETVIDKIMFYCKKCSETPDYITKEFIDTGYEADVALSDIWWYSNERFPELDKIYIKIIDMFDTASEQLPLTSYSSSEKVTMYKKLQKFYSGEDYTAMYRSDFFCDLDKAYRYQKTIDKLSENIAQKKDGITVSNESGIHFFGFDEISLSDMAEKFEKEGEYEKAIEYYKRSYEDGNELYETVMSNISHVYLKMGDVDTAVSYLEQILDNDKYYIDNALSEHYVYSGYICAEMIKLLIEQNHFEKARNYAKELIHYELPETTNEDNEYAVRYVLSGYYYLYLLEKAESGRNNLWNDCLMYYDMLGDENIGEELFDFIIEYTDKQSVSYEEIIKIIDRIDEWDGMNVKENIIKRTIEKYFDETDFEKYHIIFLLKLAELTNNYPYRNINTGLQHCDLAQDFYNKYGIKDKYIQSLIFNTKAELYSNIDNYDYDELKRLRALCDYKLLAEHKILNTSGSEEEKTEIWKDAADNYNYADNNEMRIVCLNEALKILKPIMNEYDFSQFDGNYWSMMYDLIFSYICIKDYEHASVAVYEVYEELIKLYFKEEISERYFVVGKIESLADFLSDAFMFTDSVRMYLVSLYVCFAPRPNIKVLSITEDSNSDILRLCKIICSMIDGEVDHDIVDSLIGIKDKMVKYRDYGISGGELYDFITAGISDRFQNKEMEFKHK